MKILCAYSPRFIPIIKVLAREHKHEIITFQPAFQKALRDLDIEAKYISDYSDSKIAGHSFVASAKILNQISQPFSRNGISESAMSYMSDGVIGHLYPRLSELASIVLMLDDAQPDLMLIHNDVEPLLRTIALWAKKNSVPCLHIPHSVYIDVEKGAIGHDVHDLQTASHVIAGGDFQIDWLIKRGFPAENIFQTGLPQFDIYAHPTVTRERAYRILNLDSRRPVISFSMSWRQNTNLLGCHDGIERTFLKFLRAAHLLPSAQFIITIHPNAAKSALEWLLLQAKVYHVPCAVVPQPLEVILAASDVIISYGGSNLILDGAFYPHLRLLVTHGYEDDNCVMKIGNDDLTPEHLAESIKMSLAQSTPDTTEFRNKYCGPFNDGQNFMRIVNVAENLLKVQV